MSFHWSVRVSMCVKFREGARSHGLSPRRFVGPRPLRHQTKIICLVDLQPQSLGCKSDIKRALAGPHFILSLLSLLTS